MNQKTANRGEIAQFLDQLLNIEHIRDYCPNGLQVEGKNDIRLIISGVTASLALINEAVNARADAILVHHGFFWRDEDPRIIGAKYRRIKKLMDHNINLFAYHIPLDIHPTLGNNAQLAKLLNLQISQSLHEDHPGYIGTINDPLVKTIGDLAQLIELHLKRKPLLIGDPNQPLKKIGWCSGAAQDMITVAARQGANVYISGEISERTVHDARENNIAYLTCGHHATERYGIQVLGDALASQFGISHQFIEIENPV